MEGGKSGGGNKNGCVFVSVKATEPGVVLIGENQRPVQGFLLHPIRIVPGKYWDL